MRRFCFAVLAGTAAAVPALFKEAQADVSQEFSAVDCSEQMNKEREPLGFPKFTVLDTTTHSQAEETVNTSKLCETIKANGDPGVWITETDISVAAAIQSSTEGDCAAATKQWKGVLKAMGDSLPAAYTPGEGIYDNLDVVSLMSLYTPKAGVAVACTVIQCSEKSSSTDNDQNGGNSNGQNSQTPQNPSPPQANGGGTGAGSTAGSGDGSPSAGTGDVSGSSEGNAGDTGTVQEKKDQTAVSQKVLKKKEDEGSAPMTESGVSEGEVGGVSPPAAAPPAAAAGEGVAVGGGIRVRRLEEGGEGVTQQESFNALVCIFKPKTLTKGVAPFQ